MRISDWSSDVCSSDLLKHQPLMRRVVGNQAAKPRGIGIIDLNAARQIEPRRRIMRGDQSPLDSVRIGERCLHGVPPPEAIGSASCRESVCKYASISVVGVSLKKTTMNVKHNHP